ncbi:MAG TPA: ABC-F family ATP-binding cassette domain-containing protein [Acidimicrobiales bacterium]|nr:ABC-F family ATP-binding cassette domain-containing protein [Acidimicrobiales bacterium]
MIVGSSLNVEIGDRTLLADASFVVGAGEKVGLVGRNGAGKSSLISVLVGEPSAQVRSRGNVRITGTLGWLPQVPPPQGMGLEPSGFSHVLSARGLDVLDDALDQARRQMAKDPTTEAITLFSDLEQQYRENGGYEAEAVMGRLAAGIGLPEDLLLDDIEALSGGQRRRVDLIRVLFQQPDVMILDEPTNHLDLAAKQWLMDELAAFPGALLVVSHDLQLLDRSITKVFHLTDGRLHEYKGTYSSYRTQLAADTAQRERAAELEGREIKRLSTLADAMRGQTARRARVAKSLDRRVQRLEQQRTEVFARERQAVFRLPAPQRSGAVPLEVQHLAVRYAEDPVLSDVTFTAGRGDRIVVIGRNGAGKSSLLRCLAGVQAPTAGAATLGPNVTVGYFAQEHEQIDPAKTALANVDDTVLKTDPERRALLGSFGLPSKAADQMPATLSGGERAKLGLAMLAAGRANLLILDEPTNNLDPASIDAVGRMLSAWPGTLVVVSHDRSFVAALDPTHALSLPDERFDFWRDEYLDDVALR